MKIMPVMTTGTVPLTDVITVRAASGRVYLPSNQFVHFEHISGIPTTGQEGGGYSVTKLRILDSILDRMAVMKGERPEVKTEGLSNADMDSTIASMQNDLREALKNAASTPFAAVLGGGPSANGQLFSFFA
ncbi:MAG: hypothetical protein FWG35_08725 [Spirochaetaceae bacterium]|nr:hypothetical protein [Spirochaetaceae bacterium]